MISKLRQFMGAFVFVFAVFAAASPTVLTYQGRIIKSDGTALEYNSVSFLFQILDPSGTCLVYQEQFSGYNMVNSKGIFDVPIGSGAVQYPNSGSFTIADAFNNASTFSCGSCSLSGSTYSCSTGSGSFPAAATDGRKLRVSFFDGSAWQTISPDLVIRSVPYSSFANSAQRLGNYLPSDFVIKTGIPTCAAGEFLTWSGSTLSCAGVTGSNGGTVTNVSSANTYISVATATTTPVLTLNVGTTAGTVAAGNDSRIVNALQPSAAVGGDLTGTYASPTVAKIQGVEVSSTAPSNGHFLKYNGTNWLSSAIAISDVTSLTSQLSGMMTQASFNSMVSSASCTTSQTMYWNSVSSTFACQNIAFPAASQWTTTGSDIYYNTGKVGIGTSTPANPLDVLSTDYRAARFAITDSNTLVGYTSAIAIQNLDSTSGNRVALTGRDSTGATNAGIEFIFNNHIGNSGSAGMTFLTRNSGTYASRMTISSSGNVGIGTTTPNELLVVGADLGNLTGSNSMVLADSGASSAPKFFIGEDTNNYSFLEFNNSTDQLRFTTKVAGTNYSSVLVLDKANVGVGTTAPTSKLTVAGTIESTSGGIKFPDGTTQTTAATGGGSGGFTNLVVLTTSGSWTVPAGVTKVKVTAIGGGGAGAGNFTTDIRQGGGGAGGVAIGILTVTPGNSISYTIGAGGVGATGTSGNGVAGGNGGATTFSTLTANGGSGAPVGATQGIGMGGSGGAASGGTLNIKGSSGQPGFNSFISSGANISGAGASTSWGAGGEAVIRTSAGGTDGNDGSGYGAGGSGGVNFSTGSTSKGGNGAPGAVILEY